MRALVPAPYGRLPSPPSLPYIPAPTPATALYPLPYIPTLTPAPLLYPLPYIRARARILTSRSVGSVVALLENLSNKVDKNTETIKRANFRMLDINKKEDQLKSASSSFERRTRTRGYSRCAAWVCAPGTVGMCCICCLILAGVATVVLVLLL